jgi:DNA-binding response OmpR family regulator
MTRILVIEDDAAIAMGLQDDLAMDGYHVEVARDGLEGLRLAKEGAFDLLLLDLMLPGKDGLAICRELRRGGCLIPILMLTARAQESEKVLGLELGADDYVTKPFGTHELRARIKALLRRAAPPPEESVFRFGNIEIDFPRGEVRRDGVPIELTAIEFKLLSLFTRCQGRVLNREQLLDAAWGPGVHVSGRVVDNHVVYLRRKIEPDPAEPRYLKSVRGLGYRFDA